MAKTRALQSQSGTVRGSLAIMAGAGIWGIFWIPLRYFDANEVRGLWAVALVLGASLFIALPLLALRTRSLRGQFKWITLIGTGIGLSSVLYFSAVIFSDVVRVIFLFYMLPIWATLTARTLYGQRIHPRQMAAIAMALTGLYLLLGGDGGFPIPRNIGDWFGLASGFFWGLSLTIISRNPGVDPFANATAPFLFGTPLAILIGLGLLAVAPDAAAPLPSFESVLPLLPLAIAFGCLLAWPSMLGQVWGARFVTSTTASLLTMTEILVATTSAWLLIGTTLTPLAALGGAIILVAALVDLTAAPAGAGQQP